MIGEAETRKRRTSTSPDQKCGGLAAEVRAVTAHRVTALLRLEFPTESGRSSCSASGNGHGGDSRPKPRLLPCGARSRVCVGQERRPAPVVLLVRRKMGKHRSLRYHLRSRQQRRRGVCPPWWARGEFSSVDNNNQMSLDVSCEGCGCKSWIK
jgi:hypothetical protein